MQGIRYSRRDRENGGWMRKVAILPVLVLIAVAPTSALAQITPRAAQHVIQTREAKAFSVARRSVKVRCNRSATRCRVRLCDSFYRYRFDNGPWQQGPYVWAYFAVRVTASNARIVLHPVPGATISDKGC